MKLSDIIKEMIESYYENMSEVDTWVKIACLGWNKAIVEQLEHPELFVDVIKKLEDSIDLKELDSWIDRFKEVKLLRYKSDNRLIHEPRVKDSFDGGKDIDIVYSLVDLPVTIKVGRNEPCPCGSGKKYKKCCISS